MDNTITLTKSLVTKFGEHYCIRCRKRINIGDKFISKSGKRTRKIYCLDCWNKLWYDIAGTKDTITWKYVGKDKDNRATYVLEDSI